MDHKHTTKHIRNRLRAQGIKARVSLYAACGSRWIRVVPVAADASWNGEEAQKIAICAKVNGLTYSQGMEIDDSIARWHDSGATNFHFVFP